MKNQFLRRKRVTVAGNCLGGPKIVNFRHGQFWDRAEIGNFGTRLEGAGPTSRAPRSRPHYINDCVYVCLCVYIYIYIYVFVTCVCIYIYICVHIYIHIYIYMYIYT